MTVTKNLPSLTIKIHITVNRYAPIQNWYEEITAERKLKNQIIVLTFYQKIRETLIRTPTPTPIIIATVIKTQGSVPREVGAKMLIFLNGQIYGTIGGGAGEAKVIQEAVLLFQVNIQGNKTPVEQTSNKKIVEIDLSGALDKEIQGICGGTMQVLLELWENNWAVGLVNQIINALSSGKTITLVTPLETSSKPYLLSDCDQESDKKSVSNLSQTTFIEKLTPSPTLLIIGAGHIAVPLAKIATIAGFEIIVQDDRPKYACQERFPDAINILSQPIESITEILQNNSNLYIALVTRGYLQDLEALRVILNNKTLKHQSTSKPKYIGMIGSKKRINTAFQVMQDYGYPSDILQTIHAPIGLEIGALTPEEIAISICAELIKIRRMNSN
ncbi:MAG: XdhC family protein [Mastigocoleus sp.]